MDRHIIYFLLLAFILITSCRSDENLESGTVVVHPIKDNIPYIDRDHIDISINNIWSENEFLPDLLLNLKAYLQEEVEFEMIPLEVHVNGIEDVDIASIDSTRIVILDKMANGFFLYDLSSHRSTLLAKAGRGPGDIAYPQEMAVYNDEVYVAREDLMISKFLCRQGSCEYDSTIPLEYSAVSFTKADSHYAVLGQTLLRENSEPEIDRKAVRIIDKKGKTKDTFGLFYETDHWIVLFSIRGGMVRYSENQKKYILAFNNLPLIYVFDEELAIDQTYTFEKYLQGEILYLAEMNASGPPANDMTTITKLEVIDHQYLLIATTTRFKEDDSETGYIFEQDYYALNVESSESYYLGGQSSELNTLIYPLQENLIMNQDGELYYVK